MAQCCHHIVAHADPNKSQDSSMVSNVASASDPKRSADECSLLHGRLPFVLLPLLSYQCKAIQCGSQSLCTFE